MKIFDCFSFFNELELLELRLHTLNDIADYFVLVEPSKTYTNKAREFVFEQNKQRFSDFLHKIIYVKVTDLPDGPDAWVRENYQRDCISRGIVDAAPDDLIIISDLDEIPNPDKILQCADSKIPASFEQKLYYYYVNCLNTRTLWNGSVAVRKKYLPSPQQLRAARGKTIRLLKSRIFWNRMRIKTPYLNIENGGWHFSYMGGADRIIEKINAAAHTEVNIERNNSIDFIKKTMESGGDMFEGIYKDSRISLFKKKGPPHKFVQIDDAYPGYMTKLVQKYPYLYFNPNG